MKTAKETPSGVRSRDTGQAVTLQIWRWGLLAALVALWELGARLGWLDRFYFSSPSEIVRTAVIKWQQGGLARDIAYTGLSTLLGFLFGTVIGSLVGLLFWFSRRTARHRHRRRGRKDRATGTGSAPRPRQLLF